MAAANPTPAVPLKFLVVVFAVAIVAAAVILYLGFNGLIGGPIP